MPFSSKAVLTAPNPDFANHGTTRGVWKRKTVTACRDGKLITLKTEEAAVSTCRCDIIRVGDEFFVAYTVGDPRSHVEEHQRIARSA